MRLDIIERHIQMMRRFVVAPAHVQPHAIRG
jgi:hypothetical protein